MLDFMEKMHPSGAPYCAGEYCDDVGFILSLQKPYDGQMFCPVCAQKYCYSLLPPKPPIPDNILKFQKN